jgi:hypothetical protein
MQPTTKNRENHYRIRSYQRNTHSKSASATIQILKPLSFYYKATDTKKEAKHQRLHAKLAQTRSAFWGCP